MKFARVPGVLVATALCLGVVSTASASEKRPLPQASVTASGGDRVDITSLAAEGHWLLIYVAPASTPSLRTIKALAAWAAEVPQLAERTVLVFAGSHDAAAALVTQLGDGFPPVRWVADENGTAREGAPRVRDADDRRSRGRADRVGARGSPQRPGHLPVGRHGVGPVACAASRSSTMVPGGKRPPSRDGSGVDGKGSLAV